MRKLRILHCPESVGGNPQALARAEREVGLASWAVALEESRFRYQGDETLCPAGSSIWRREMQRWPLLWRALRHFDVIHFNFGLSLTPQWSPPSADGPSRKRQVYNWYARLLELRDLPLLKRAGKGIVVTYQGDDARQGDYARAHFAFSTAQEVGPGYYSPESDARKRQRIARVARYADRIYGLNPDLLHVLPAQAHFLPYANIDIREWRPVSLERHDRPVVLHAPSHRGGKGTRFVLDAIARLQAEGIPFEFKLVENLPYAEVRKLYEAADLLIDQLLAGWYGGVAVEWMALGKPVIAYLRDEDLGYIPARMRDQLPIIQATPITCYEILKEYLTMRKEELSEIGRRSRGYVEHWHNPLHIAQYLKGEYEAIRAVARRDR